MKIIIHRGTQQTEGCVTEIKTDNAQIFIDMGAELPGTSSCDDFQIDGVTSGRPNCDAIFITHYHGDHVGLYRKILPIWERFQRNCSLHSLCKSKGMV